MLEQTLEELLQADCRHGMAMESSVYFQRCICIDRRQMRGTYKDPVEIELYIQGDNMDQIGA